MRFAAFETSSDWCSVALSIDGEIASVEQCAPNRHSELALPMLEDLLKKVSIEMKDLQAVAFGEGPGSFTGLRIACGLAQGLAVSRSLPVLGVSAFQAIAEEASAEPGARVVACIDARMREVYYAALEKHAGGWRALVPGQCVAPQAAPKPPGEGWVGAGNGFAAYPDLFKNLSVKRPEIHPTAMAVARLAGP